MSTSAPADAAAAPKHNKHATFAYACLYGNIALYAFCYMMQQPVLPKMVDEYADGEEGKAAWAKLQSTFATVQLFGGLLAGYLSDIFGPRSLLLLSGLASVAVYGLQGLATSMDELLVSQLPAMFQHAFMGTAAYITAITAADNRSQNLSYIQLFYGIGMATGPLLGGYLGETDTRVCSWLAMVGSLVGTVMLVLLPNPEVAAPEKKKPSKVSGASIVSALKQPAVFRAILIKAFSAMAMSIWHTSFVIVTKDVYDFGPMYRGFFMSYISVLGMVVIGLKLIQRLEAKMSDRKVNMLVGLVLAAGFVVVPWTARAKGAAEVYGFDISLFLLAAALIPMAASVTVLRSTITSQFTKATDPSLAGTIIGIDMGISSGLRIIAPQVGMWSMEYGFEGLGVCCAAFTLLMVLVSAVSNDEEKTKEE